MTTLRLDDQLYVQASEVAAAQGKTIDAFVSEALQHALADVCVRRCERNGLPVMVVNERVPKIDSAVVRQCLEEDGF